MSKIKTNAKLVKLESLSSDDKYAYVKNGEVFSGYFYDWPEIDHSFIFIRDASSNRFSSSSPLSTSMVKEIIDDRTFKTMNSIYKIITLEDERDDKIRIILI